MFKSLNTKIYLSISLTIIILFGFFLYVFLDHQKRIQIEDSFKEASLISEIITRATKFNMPLGNRNCVLRIMKIIGSQDAISYVRMVNDKGIVTFHPKCYKEQRNKMMKQTDLSLARAIH